MMIVFANILLAIGTVLHTVLQLMVIVVIVRAIVSWVNADPFNPVVRFLHAATEPLLKPIRKLVPPLGGGIDLSPLVLIVVLYFLQIALAQTLIDLANEMKFKARFSLEASQSTKVARLEASAKNDYIA